jgi:RPA family protein
MLASEFSDSTLNQQGSGEFDPMFIITKLGAKVNRVIVAGMLERLDPRETSNGSTLWQGQLRDPSGLHFFSVGDYAPESMRELTIQLSSRIEDGESIMLLMTAKARYFQNEEGAVYTSLRPEEAAIVTREVYRNWLVSACKGMLERMDMQEKAISLEKTTNALAAAGIPENMREGLLLAGEHYGEIDTEPYRLNIMNALDIAEDKIPSFTANSTPKSQASLEVEEQESTQEEVPAPDGEVDLNQVLLDLISRLDQGEGVDFDTLLSNAAARGHDRDASEAALDDLTEDGSVHEPRFGWFKITN